MIESLTPAQLTLLRRCDGGLRIWEVGEQFAATRASLRMLCDLGLVSHDDDEGFQLTAAGEACLVRLGR